MIELIRKTKETSVTLAVGYPAPPEEINIDIPCGFLAHMLTLMAHRSRLALVITADGDVDVDYHHLAEDIGITLGVALKEMLQTEKLSRRRYGSSLLPMDGSLARIALDISGRGGMYWEGSFPSAKCGDFDMELVPEFFTALCREARITAHIGILAADNTHHASEAIFKGFGLALGDALEPSDVSPSTKGAWI